MIKKRKASITRTNESYIPLCFEYFYNLTQSEFWTHGSYTFLCKHVLKGKTDEEKAIKAARTASKQQALISEYFAKELEFPAVCEALNGNINAVCRHLNIEHELISEAFRLSVLLSTTASFSTLIEAIIYDISCSNFALYSELLNAPEFEVKQAFTDLSKMGLLEQSYYELDRSCLLITDTIKFKLLTTDLSDKDDFIASIVTKAPDTKLKRHHFEEAFVDDIARYMQIQAVSGEAGVNILLHGQVGVGKTELARYIANHANCDLFEVLPLIDDDLDELDSSGTSGKARVRQLKLINHLFKASLNSMLVIDECEDLFVSTFHQRVSKEEIHQILGKNPRPCIWITNHIDYIPESALRRFKLVYQLPNLSKKAKLELVHTTFQGLALPTEFKAKLSQQASLSPAVLTNLAEVSKTLKLKSTKAESLCKTMVDEYLNATGDKSGQAQYQAELDFDLSMVNIKGVPATLETLKTSIKHLPNIRVLMHGPAGTGKTSFVHFLVNEYDFELKHVRCSDVLDKYVGGSEQNVARIFEEANDTESIILLDEVDSLLMNRQRMHKIEILSRKSYSIWLSFFQQLVRYEVF